MKEKKSFKLTLILFYLAVLSPFSYGETVKKDIFSSESEELEIGSTDPWKKEDVMSTQSLADALKQKMDKTDFILIHVGFSFLYKAGHIPGSIYVGPGKDPEGIETLKKSSEGFPKEKLIILYCGCCPWNQCPNIRPAFNTLKELHFNNLKILFIPHDFAQDWIRKGYPVEKGR
ncbi:rhodanese-like domain-containing protein [Methylacidiphilum caldifontis]|uniref:Sulfurtransferase n=1 Tax=Methylacidiphilum caldifontis TaxID=2795386 RepID=A0A4Y8PH55_9BACT|nr:rhodanese-like domain-containing protein [Methylacidiphilum caldifontis]TFE71774.1 sulfurtransferase [Methylacidiphilum caldifontis]